MLRSGLICSGALGENLLYRAVSEMAASKNLALQLSDND